MNDIYSATVAMTESQVGATIDIRMAVKDCNGSRCTATVELRVPPTDIAATPFEWLKASLGALSDTCFELDWKFEHAADCEGAVL